MAQATMAPHAGSLLGDLSREELLEASNALARIATSRNDTRLRSREDEGGARDPLVRRLAAFALVDLHSPNGRNLSYRKLADMFGVSTSRIHALYHDLVDAP